MADENAGRPPTEPVRVTRMGIAPADPTAPVDAPLVIVA
jgi:hypothetical protein